MSGKNGIILIDKNEGFTSSDTVRFAGRRLKARKTGHTGTLDKFASGLLVCLAGSFTRLSSYLTEQDKVYEATFEFGRETETLDPEGAVCAEGGIPVLEDLESALVGFRGEILQKPPLYSAVHINGTRAYKRALKGEVPDMPSRRIFIESLEITGYTAPFLSVRVACSKGTYIRSLARDVAYSLGTVAYVKSLRRLQVGRARIEDAIGVDEINEATPVLDDRKSMESLLGITGICIPEAEVESFLLGRSLNDAGFLAEIEAGAPLICFDSDGRFLGLLKKKEERWVYGMVNGALRD
ncbi:tRNA pseudouridine(55) synthase TruB [Marispirochaeta aestuarii]|uniref:tRNA pseudouridine(55) synthase TruB n=1 Tax=Marispirochaeta aestuarii TaxID=1963862 RepID=UPI0029C699B2|nr:tRNA pseudouridine(55) synthase TruB [Marispirochaeta aestuarii]